MEKTRNEWHRQPTHQDRVSLLARVQSDVRQGNTMVVDTGTSEIVCFELNLEVGMSGECLEDTDSLVDDLWS